MPTRNQAFSVVKGEDIEIDWTIYASAADGAAVVDLTGWTFSFKLKRFASDADPSLATAVNTILVAAAGTVKTVLAAADTLLLEGTYQYSFWRTNSGSKACLSAGVFDVVDTPEN